MYGWETDGMLLNFLLFRCFFVYFQTKKLDCYGYLTVCPSHFSPHLSSCELLRSPFLFFNGVSLFLYVSHCYLYGLSVFLPCAPCRRVGLYSTEEQKTWDDLLFFSKKKRNNRSVSQSDYLDSIRFLLRYF